MCLAVRQSDLNVQFSTPEHLVFNNELKFYSLDESFKVIEHLNVEIPSRIDNEQFEDPRVLVHDNKVFVSCCNYSLKSQKFLHQTLLEFDQSLEFIGAIDPVYGGNGNSIRENTRTEKNWTWFALGMDRYCVYSMSPHLVVKFHHTGLPEASYATYVDTIDMWQFGECRMGSNPVLLNGLFYNFFHSSLPWRNGKRQYFMGAYTFEPEPPFQITQITSKPLLYGSENDIRQFSSPLVIFPCGAIFIDDEWVVSSGVNDERSAWFAIPHKTLLRSLISV